MRIFKQILIMLILTINIDGYCQIIDHTAVPSYKHKHKLHKHKHQINKLSSRQKKNDSATTKTDSSQAECCDPYYSNTPCACTKLYPNGAVRCPYAPC